jgi:hypothetical protein
MRKAVRRMLPFPILCLELPRSDRTPSLQRAILHLQQFHDPLGRQIWRHACRDKAVPDALIATADAYQT